VNSTALATKLSDAVEAVAVVERRLSAEVAARALDQR
jgi:hypothetical protein